FQRASCNTQPRARRSPTTSSNSRRTRRTNCTRAIPRKPILPSACRVDHHPLGRVFDRQRPAAEAVPLRRLEVRDAAKASRSAPTLRTPETESRAPREARHSSESSRFVSQRVARARATMRCARNQGRRRTLEAQRDRPRAARKALGVSEALMAHLSRSTSPPNQRRQPKAPRAARSVQRRALPSRHPSCSPRAWLCSHASDAPPSTAFLDRARSRHHDDHTETGCRTRLAVRVLAAANARLIGLRSNSVVMSCVTPRSEGTGDTVSLTHSPMHELVYLCSHRPCSHRPCSHGLCSHGLCSHGRVLTSLRLEGAEPRATLGVSLSHTTTSFFTARRKWTSSGEVAQMTFNPSTNKVTDERCRSPQAVGRSRKVSLSIVEARRAELDGRSSMAGARWSALDVWRLMVGAPGRPALTRRTSARARLRCASRARLARARAPLKACIQVCDWRLKTRVRPLVP
ncbi:MAG: hypothetical protein RIR10_590, partial [Planctomycetota bacterium]